MLKAPDGKLTFLGLGCVAVVLALGVLFSTSTTSTVARTDQPGVIMDVFDPSLAGYAPMWQKEIGRRFPHAVGVLCHGGELLEGEWITLDAEAPVHFDLVTTLIAREQAKYPGREIVVLCCNPGHIAIHNFPGVYYSPSSVWCVPDRSYADLSSSPDRMKMLDLFHWGGKKSESKMAINRWSLDPDATGNIFEFIEAK